jgi:rod shape determining protein RodA
MVQLRTANTPFHNRGLGQYRPTIWIRFHLDWVLLLAIGAVVLLGLMILASAGNQEEGILLRQLTRLGLAFFVMFIVAQIPIRFYLWAVPYIYIFGIGLLIAVLLVGDVGKGAQRWLDLKFIRFQPSEFMKLAVPMMVAYYFADRPLPCNFKDLVISLVIIVVPVLLIAKQPDLGTSLLIASSGLFAVFLAGLPWKYIFSIAFLAVIGAPVAWLFMHDYQRKRVLMFLNPETDRLGSGYHIIQSKIAIGSGGFFGKGWFEGTQSQLSFLPERSTDFIFAVLAEEWGFVGVLFLLILYFLLIARCAWISSRASDSFTRLVAGSITFTLAIYIVINIGMVSDLLPVVGMPLPLVSYGGTSIVTLMAGFGMLMAIYTKDSL